MSRILRYSWLLLSLGLAEPAPAEPGDASMNLSTLTQIAVYVDACIRSDTALRAICTRHRSHLPVSVERYCTLPDAPFADRTADAYAQFRSRHRALFDQARPRIEKIIASANRAFANQFADLLAGRLRGMDLELLSKELGEHCHIVESEWLRTEAPGG